MSALGVKLEPVIGRTTLMEHRDNTCVAETDEELLTFDVSDDALV